MAAIGLAAALVFAGSVAWVVLAGSREPDPVGLDPETVAAARRIASRLRG